MKFRKWIAGTVAAAILITGIPLSAAAAQTDNGSGAEPMTQERVDAANEAYNDAKTQLEIISMSDTHVASYESKKPAFQSIGEWASRIGFGTDAVMIDGDVEANERLEFEDSSRTFYEAVIRLVDETFGKDMTVMYSVGNHDRPGDYMMPMFNEAKADGRPNWYFEQEDGSDYSNYHVKVNGFDFITLDYRNYSAFLNQTLEEISSAEDYDPAKPVFVQVHSGLSGTTWGGYQDIAGSAIQTALADYPQAIVMTAHSHYSNEAENGIYQGDFTVVNNGSMDYVELPSSLEPVLPHAQGKFENGELVEYERTCNFISVLEDGTTVIRRYDATNRRWMGMPWIIETAQGKDGFRYTDEKRSGIAPWFEEDADISVSNVTETAADLTFTQAVDDELTEHYEISVREVLGNKAATYTVEPEYFGNNEAKTYTGSFTVYSRFYLRPYPEEMKLYFTDLSPATAYRITVTAVDNFGNESEPQEITFTTGGDKTDLPDELPEGFEEGLLVDMKFENSLEDEADADSQNVSSGNISYEDGVYGSTAVRVPAGASIDLGARTELDSLGTDKSATYSFWYKLYGMKTDQMIFGNKDWENAVNPGMAFAIGYNDSDETHVSGSVGDGKSWDDGTETKYTSYEGLKQGEWNLLTLKADRTEKTLTTYVNGQVCETAELPDGLTLSSGMNYHIGCDGNGSYSGLDFAMDNLRVWNRALSDEEILAIYGTEYPDRDDTDYGAQLEDTLKEAHRIVESAESGKEGIYHVSYDAGRIERLKEKLAEAEDGLEEADSDEIAVFVSDLQYLIEQAEASKELSLDPPTVLPEGIREGLLVDMQFENSLKDDVRTVSGQDGETVPAEGTACGEISYEEGVHDSTAVRVENGEYIDLGACGELDSLGTEGSATYSFWYRSYASQADQVIFGNKSWSSATNAGLVLAYDYNDADPTHISGSIGPGNGDYGQTSYTRFRGLSKDGWNHLTMTADREEGVYTTYVNGIPYETGKLAEAATLTSGQNYHIGAAPGGSYAGLDFAMDNLRIWNRVLSEEEIASIYGTDLLGVSEPEEPDQPGEGGNSGSGGSGGSGGSSPVVRYEVNLPSDTEQGSVTADAQRVSAGSIVTVTAEPKDGYELESLTVTDGEGNAVELTDLGGGTFTFRMPSSSVTVSAVFTEIQEPSEEPQELPFGDVAEGVWYEEAVRYVRENGLMEGTSADTFEPAAGLTRAMMAQLLYNRAGRPAVSEGSGFDDVNGDQWYADAVAWAAAEGIVNGVTESLFAPDQPITREQLAVMMYRYAGSPEVSDLTLEFSDADRVSDYAEAAVCWAVSEGVMNGNDGGTLNPAGNTTRAEAAQLLMNYFSGR